jgi:hypothetical protein
MNSRAPRGQGARQLQLQVSDDGYVRLGVADFRSIPLFHCLSELDSDAPEPARRPSGAVAASIDGYTEWVSETTPALSLGWDWRIATTAGSVRYVRDGDVRSNVMLIDVRGGDIGAMATGVLLCVAVDALGWEKIVADYITNRYACHLSNLTVTETRSSL